MTSDTVQFTVTEIKRYLDECIQYWRSEQALGREHAQYYIDAYQSVGRSLFGELSPIGKITTTKKTGKSEYWWYKSYLLILKVERNKQELVDGLEKLWDAQDRPLHKRNQDLRKLLSIYEEKAK